jgi:hypothetical protein
MKQVVEATGYINNRNVDIRNTSFEFCLKQGQITTWERHLAAKSLPGRLIFRSWKPLPHEIRKDELLIYWKLFPKTKSRKKVPLLFVFI